MSRGIRTDALEANQIVEAQTFGRCLAQRRSGLPIGGEPRACASLDFGEACRCEPIPYDTIDIIGTAVGDLDYPKLITNPLAPTESAGFRIPGPWRQMRPTMASDRQLEVDRPRQKQDRLASAHPLRLNRSGGLGGV
jgi:hypothetical protein